MQSIGMNANLRKRNQSFLPNSMAHTDLDKDIFFNTVDNTSINNKMAKN
jgi:hypothetical protein